MVGFGKVVLMLAGFFGLVASSFADSPKWTLKAKASMVATVATIDSKADADIVILDGGVSQKLLTGMVCEVLRGSQKIAKVVIIESFKSSSAGLIISGSEVKVGDVARAVPTI